MLYILGLGLGLGFVKEVEKDIDAFIIEMFFAGVG